MADEPTPVEIPGERFEQETFRKPERIDKEKGEMYGVRVMGLQSAHGYAYTLEAHKAAAKHFEQMAVGIDHDYSGGPLTSENAWGVFHNVRTDDKGTVADLRFLQSHPRTPQVLEDIERDLGLFSFSPVTTAQRGEARGQRGFVCARAVRSGGSRGNDQAGIRAGRQRRACGRQSRRGQDGRGVDRSSRASSPLRAIRGPRRCSLRRRSRPLKRRRRPRGLI